MTRYVRLFLFSFIIPSAFCAAQPQIQVSPGYALFNLPHGDSTTSTLSILNIGTGTLHFTLKRMNPTEMSPASQPFSRRIAFQPGEFIASGGNAGGRSTREGTEVVAAAGTITKTQSAAGLKVLLVAADNASQLSAHLLTYPDIQTVAYFDSRSGTPTLSQLEQYDVILTWTNSSHNNRIALGNVLADYVDGGGSVVIMTFSFLNTTSAGLGGRIISGGYSPFTSAGLGNRYSYATLGSIDASHPIMQGVTAAQDYYRDYVTLTAGSELVASWSDGEEYVAVKGSVAAVNGYFGDSRVWSGDAGLILHNTANFVAHPAWLTLSQESGDVLAGGTTDITMRANASSIFGGQYDAIIRIQSNDTSQSTIDFPVHLNVTGTASLVVSVDTLRFGTYYQFYPDTLSFTISNTGTDSLRIYSLVSPSPDVAVSPATPFAVRVNGGTTVKVVYKRTLLGSLISPLTISSNDSTQVDKQVILTGSSLAPPVINASPDSLALSATVGDSASTTIQLSNDGLSDLLWSISGTNISPAQAALSRAAEEMKKRGKQSAETAGIAASAEIEFLQSQSPGNLDIALLAADITSYAQDVRTKLLATGQFNSITIIYVQSVTPTLNELLNYGAVMVWRDYGFLDPGTLGDNLADYVDAGGGVVTAVFAAEYGSSIIGGRFDAENYWAIVPGSYTSGHATLGTVHFPQHPVMNGVSTFDGGGTSYRYQSNVVTGGRSIADWSDGNPLVAERFIRGIARIDLGMFPPSSAISSSYWLQSTNGALLMANSLKFVGRKFLAISPSSGTIPAGMQQMINVKATAADLIGGTYLDAVTISSNDPVTPVLNVPVSFDVSGYSHIVLAGDTVDFGEGFVTYPDTVNVTIFNTGTDSLSVTGYSSSNSEVSVVDNAPFRIGVNKSKSVRLRYSRASVTGLNATVTIASNDSGVPSKIVHVMGQTISPPVMGLSQSSIPVVNMNSGDSTVRPVSLTNSGNSNLVYSTKIVSSASEQLPRANVNAGKSGVYPFLRGVRHARELHPSPLVRIKTPPLSADEDGARPTVVTGAQSINLPTSLYDTLGFEWRIQRDGRLGSVSGGGYDAGFDLNGFNNFSTAETEDNGREIVIGPQSYDSVQFVRKIFVPSNAAFVRYLDVISNNTAGPQSVSVEVYTDLGSDGDEEFSMTSDGDTIFTPADRWIVTDDIPDAGYPAVGNIIDGPGGKVDPSQVVGGEGFGYMVYQYEVIIPPNSEIILMHFGTERVNASECIASAQALVNLEGEATAGMSIAERMNVVNFDVTNMFDALPISGTVGAGLTDSIYAVYDAENIVTGVYNAKLRVSSNDPVTPSMDVSLSASVTGIPNLHASADTLLFGQGYVGFPDTLELKITNTGTEALAISGMVSGDAEAIVLDSTSFILLVNREKTVRIRYARTFAGTLAAGLTLQSNDPDTPAYVVQLLGNTLPAPAISTTPDSLYFSLSSGDSTASLLTIHNTGLGQLDWSISSVDSSGTNPIVEANARALRNSAVRPMNSVPLIKSRSSASVAEWKRESTVVVRYAAQQSAGQLDVAIVAAEYIDAINDVVNTLLATGQFNSITGIGAESVTPTVDQLKVYDAILVWANYSFANPIQFGDNLASYVDAGGGVVTGVFAGNGNNIQGRFLTQDYWAIQPNDILYGAASLGAIHIPNHPIMEGVNTFYGGGESYRYNTSPRAGSIRVADWQDGNPLIVQRIINGINRVDLCFYPPSSNYGGFYYWDAGTDGGKIMANALQYVGGKFLTANPLSGSLPGGGSQDLALKVFAKQGVAGNYLNNLGIQSNDPGKPVLNVPVWLNVRGNPIIQVAPDTLNFAEGFVGYADTLSLTISNAGTDDLHVSSIVTGNPEYSYIDSTSFTVLINGSRTVRVRLARTLLGSTTSVLSIASDDTTTPVRDVHLTGTTIEPPIFGLTHDSLSLAIVAGEDTTRMMTIHNTGASDLNWTTRVFTSPGSQANIEAAVRRLQSRSIKPPQSPAASGIEGRGADESWTRESSAHVVFSSVQTGGPNIALLAADNNASITDVRNKLLATAAFSSITTIQTSSVTPKFDELLAFDAVLVWSNNGPLNATALGDVLADYVDDGGGVVTGLFLANTYHLSGRFVSDNYWAIAASYTVSGASALGTRHEPNHPVFAGVTSFNGGSTSYRYQADITPGARRIADWSDGNPLIVERTINGTSRIDLGIFPPSSAVSSGYWNAATDGARLMANALLYVGRSFTTTNPAMGTVAAGATQDVALEISAGQLVTGTYTNNVSVETNDPVTPVKSFDVVLAVSGSPELSVTDDSLEFGDGFIGQNDTLQFSITNSGTDALSVTGMSVGGSEFALLDSTSFTLGVHRTKAIRVRYPRASLGLHERVLTISSNDASQPATNIVLEGTTSPPPSSAGNGVNVDGVTQFVEVPYDPSKALFNLNSSLTYEIWVNPLSGGPLINRQQCAVAWPSVDLSLGGQSPAYDLSFTLNNANWSYYQSFSASNVVPHGKWSHIAATFDQSTNEVKLFVNGILVQSGSYSSTPWLAGTSLWIMGIPSPGSGCFSQGTHGTVDEVRVWNVTRTQQQLRDGMHISFSEAERNLVGYWRFNEASSDTAFDISGEGNLAFLRNGASRTASGAFLHNGVTFRPGRLVVSSDDIPTSNTGYGLAPSGSASKFVSNMVSLFTGGVPGKFLIYSDHDAFGTLFRNTLTSAGHQVDQSLSPASLSLYKGIFVGGYTAVNLDSLYMYIRGGGNLYLAAGAIGDTLEEAFWNQLTSFFAIRLNGEFGLSPRMNTSFIPHPLFSGVFGLYTGDPSSMQLAGGYLPRTQIISSRGDVNYVAVYDGTTQSLLPEPPILSSPPDGSSFSAITQTLQWYINTPVTSYRVEVASDGLFQQLFRDVVQSPTQITLTNLQRNTTYHWRIRSLNTAGMGQPSPVWTFKTIPDAPPAIPELVAPADNALNLNISSSTFIWHPSLNASVYHIQISKDSLFATIAKTDSGLLDTSRAYSGLETNTLYYWRVRAANLEGESGFSPLRRFTTERLPDLQVTGIQTPASVFSGQFLEVHWIVTNTWDGVTNAPVWYDRLYLSPDSVFDAQVSFNLGTYQNPTYLNPGESYSNIATLTIPNGLTGNYYIFVATDVYNSMRELGEQNNERRSAPVLVNLTPPPDLEVIAVVTPGNTFSGLQIPVAWSVRNSGTGATRTNSWRDALYLSTDSVLQTNIDRLLITQNHFGELGVDSSYNAIVNVTIPYNIYGKQFVIAVTDVNNNEFEFSGESNNVSVSDSIKVTLNPPPDLVVTGITAPLNANSGTEIDMTWTVMNEGAGPTYENAWYDAVYISRSPAFAAESSMLVGSIAHYGSIETDSGYSRTAKIKIPNGVQGIYYVYVRTDNANQVFEHTYDGNNMLKRDTPVTIQLSPWPDLRVLSVAGPADVTAGEQLSLDWTVLNAGTAATGHRSWSDNLYISPNSSYDPSFLTLLKTAGFAGNLDTGATTDRSAVVTIPSGYFGLYYFYVLTDAANAVYEYTDEGNNFAGSGSLNVGAYPPIDLALDSLHTPVSMSSGDTIRVTWRVKNAGAGRTLIPNWEDVAYLSPDTTLDTDTDVKLLVSPHIGALNAGASYTRLSDIRIPDELAGTFHLFVATDFVNNVGDISLGNNYRRFQTPMVIGTTPVPDLTVLSLTPPLSGVVGQPISIPWVVKNIGVGEVRQNVWFDAVYLSQDTVVQSSDTKLGFRYIPKPLLPNDTYTDTLSINLPYVPAGDYYAILKADNRGDIYESNSESNNFRSAPLTINSQPPSDLVVRSVDFADTSVIGDYFGVSWVLKNNGPNNVNGQVVDAAYISLDSVWDINDPLLGVYERHVFLLAGQTEKNSLRVNLAQIVIADSLGYTAGNLPGIVPGQYRVIIRTDIRNNIYEAENANNTTPSGKLLTGILSTLTLGTPVVDTLTQGEIRYYQVSATAGEVLRVSLATTNANASNEVFVRFGTMPSRRDFDFSFSNPFENNQEVFVPETREGVYYIMVRCDRAPGFQRDTVLAAIVDYQVTNIVPSKGANTGNVTLKISGAKFQSGNQFFLKPAGSTDTTQWIPAIQHSIISSSQASATFDLRGKTAGIYDLFTQNSYTWLAADLADTSNITYAMQTIVNSTAQAGSFEILSGGKPDLRIKLVTPSAVSVNRDLVVTMDVFNAGTADAKAPVVMLTSPTGSPLNFSLPIDPTAPTSRRILILSPGFNRDVFAPGERTTIRVFTRSPGRGVPLMKFVLEDQTTAESTPINWDDFEQQYFDSTSPAQWNATWTLFKQLAGTTFGELHEALRKLAVNRAPGADRYFYFESDLMDELIAYARNGITELPGGEQVAAGSSPSLTSTFRDRLQDSVAALFPQRIGDHASPDQTLLCIGEWDAFQAELHNTDVQNKWCSSCMINSTCLAFSVPAVATPLLTAWTLESAAFGRPYIAHGLARYFLGSGDIHWSEFDQISQDAKNSPEVEQRMNQIYAATIPKVKEFIHESDGNCGSGLYNIEQFISPEMLHGSIDFGGEGNAASHGLVRTLGGVSPTFSGYVTLLQVGTLSNGVKRFELKMNLKLHIDDRYDFCPSSGPSYAGDSPTFDYVFFQLRQFEKCGLATPYHNVIDVALPSRIVYVRCGGSGSDGGGDDDGDGDGDGDDGPPAPPAPPDPNPDDPNVPVLAPSDPNDIVGPAGHGDERWIGINQPLAYTIHYENDPKKASAPAQVVTITQQLDTTFDARTFRVGEFGFGSFVFSVPANRSFYSQRLDVRDSLGVYVDVNAGIDITTNRAFWILKSIDPATGEQPENPILGFLLLNDSLHHGDGFVSYTIKPKKATKTGERADAKAQIVFDEEDPIDTPPTFNTIDAGLPVSGVLPIVTKLDSVSVNVAWSAVDDSTGSGIRDYSVYVSKNNEPFEIWQSDVEDTSSVFSGEKDQTYQFFSIARDYAGNVELMKTQADATVVLTEVQEVADEMPREYGLSQNYPNPFNPLTTLRYQLPVASSVTLRIYDVLGREVKTLVEEVQAEGFKSVVWDSRNRHGSTVSTGVYFYRIDAVSVSGPTRRFSQVMKMLLVK